MLQDGPTRLGAKTQAEGGDLLCANSMGGTSALVTAFTPTVRRASKLTQALLWHYESWTWVRMRRGGVGVEVSSPSVFFFPLLQLCTGSNTCCQFPEHREPLFCCQSNPDVLSAFFISCTSEVPQLSHDRHWVVTKIHAHSLPLFGIYS